MLLRAIFKFIRILFRYTDNCLELCTRNKDNYKGLWYE